MKRYVLQAAILARGETVYVGIDVSRTGMAICVLSKEREILCQRTVPYDERSIRELVRALPDCEIHAVYEAGPTGYALLRWLRAHPGVNAFMVAPSRMPTTTGDRVKTDKKDALKLAALLAAGMLDGINDLTDEQYADRQLVRCRGQAVRRKVRGQLQIKSLMLMHGITLPEHIKPTWSKAMRASLAQNDTGHFYLNVSLREQLHWIDDAKASISRLNRACTRLSQEPRYVDKVKLLRSIPGFGIITTMVLLTELPDLEKRFENGEALARYLGLVPTEHSTGQTQGRRGHIVRDGNAFARGALVEACWRVVRKDAGLHARFTDIAKRRGKKKAIVAIARHMAMTIYAMFRDNKPYRRQEEPQQLAA